MNASMLATASWKLLLLAALAVSDAASSDHCDLVQWVVVRDQDILDRLSSAGAAADSVAAISIAAAVLAVRWLGVMPPYELIGDYVVVGREPDGGVAYSGSARIERDDDHLVLRQRRGERQITAAGRFEVPSPPDEGRVLRFLSQDPEAVTMTCIVSSDLDNYARLTCLWLRQGTEPAEPGLEAMFPTAEWPDVAPDKAFKPKGP